MRKAIYIGNLTKDPELSYINMQGGEQLPVAHFSVAANETVRGQKTVEYIECSAFGKQAKPIMDYLRRGHSVYVEGVPSVKVYPNDDGSFKVIWRLTCTVIEFTGNKTGNSSSQTIVQEPARPRSTESVDMTEEFLRSGNVVPPSAPEKVSDVKLPWEEEKDPDVPF